MSIKLVPIFKTEKKKKKKATGDATCVLYPELFALSQPDVSTSVSVLIAPCRIFLSLALEGFLAD